LPDSEAQVIRALVDRIEALEEQLEAIKTDKVSQQELTAVSQNRSCRIDDRAITEYLDGAGI